MVFFIFFYIFSWHLILFPSQYQGGWVLLWVGVGVGVSLTLSVSVIDVEDGERER